MKSILTQIEQYFKFRTPVIWANVFLIGMIHLYAIYGVYLIPTAKPITIIWVFICVMTGSIALSAGAHRLWSHKSYKAKLPLRIIIMLCYMLLGQYTLKSWVRDHRIHHKYSDTDVDPHNASRGLFFSHCGWLMMTRHPECKQKGRMIDIRNMYEDPVIRFHQKHFILLTLMIHVIFPSAVIYYVIGDTLKNSIFIGLFLRHVYSLNLTWCGTSLTHYWGFKPYSKNIRATQNTVLAIVLLGEGGHNFHHTFPWDYRSGEYGHSYLFTAQVIDAFAWCGQAYDLKTASPDLIRKVVAKQNLPKKYEVSEMEFRQKIHTIVK